jgi:hypothetical protein
MIGHRRDGRARALHRRAAIDRDAGRDRIEVVDRRPLEALQELARVGAEALDEAALPFGVERVERERGLARAGDAGDGDELTGVKVEVDPPEVVGAGAAEPDGQHAAPPLILNGRRGKRLARSGASVGERRARALGRSRQRSRDRASARAIAQALRRWRARSRAP